MTIHNNNPAGRVLHFLRAFENSATRQPAESAMLALMKLLNAPQESAEIYSAVARLRLQAEAVPTLMFPYEGSRGYASYLRHYDQIIAATKLLQIAHGYTAQQILAGVTDGGWISAEIASETLAEHISEPSLSAEQEADYLGQIQEVTKAVANDDSLSPTDRTRIVGLLRNVEQALLDIKINGSLRSRRPQLPQVPSSSSHSRKGSGPATGSSPSIPPWVVSRCCWRIRQTQLQSPSTFRR